MSAFFNAAELRITAAVSELAYCNPFLPRRIDLERKALGPEFDERYADWNIWSASPDDQPNVTLLRSRCEEIAARIRAEESARERVDASEVAMFEDLALFVLYDRWRRSFDISTPNRDGRLVLTDYSAIVTDATELLTLDGRKLPALGQLPHLLACFYQLRRAFRNIFSLIVGRSRPAIGLRAAVWQSIFSHDMRRYRRILFQRMEDYTTLITGPSGTGKELVARAIGLSRYLPFDVRTESFAPGGEDSFCALNLSALNPTLIESELFGHQAGAFTGAASDRASWLELCPEHGAVFLDEIGELDPAIQVKLLRVIEGRTFTRLGDTRPRSFRGKFIAATHRDLAMQMRQGRFRQDLYYRLCSDIVTVPTLHQRLQDSSQELSLLVHHCAEKIVGEESSMVAGEVLSWIDEHLGANYAWPGNIRELEQCVRNVLIRHEYHPSESNLSLPNSAEVSLASAINAARLTADELLQRYCALAYEKTGSYQAAARRLAIDRRTVKAKVNEFYAAEHGERKSEPSTG